MVRVPPTGCVRRCTSGGVLILNCWCRGNVCGKQRRLQQRCSRVAASQNLFLALCCNGSIGTDLHDRSWRARQLSLRRNP